jgi:hypothetical protein
VLQLSSRFLIAALLAQPTVLFDGRTLEGWTQTRVNWEVRDGALHSLAAGPTLAWTVRKLPADFDLSFEWKVERGGNSGVHYRGGAFEYQILDNSYEHATPKTRAGSLYNIAGASEDVTKPVGEWNTGRIECRGQRIRHWLNGRVVADVDTAAPEWAKALAAEQERRLKIPAPGPAREGWLALSAHTSQVWFRNLNLTQ